MRKLENNELVDLYLKDSFPYEKGDVLENKRIKIEDTPKLKKPVRSNFYEYENAKSLFEAYKGLDRVQATDLRMWTYLSHVKYWDYMQARWPVDANKPKSEMAKYILDHWYLSKISAKQISRHGIASLWWGASVTHDNKREDKYELTKEFFSRQDYKRHLLERTIARHTPLVHAILEYILENKEIFEDFWAEKVRFLTRKIHFISGYKMLSSMNKEDIKYMIEAFKDETAKVKGDVQNREST